MATITVRDVPDEVKAELRLEAARHGRSMEAEIRALLEERYRTDEQVGLGTRIHRMFADIEGADELADALQAPRNADSARVVDFGELDR